MSAIVYRVAHRFRRAALGDPKDFLVQFETILRSLEIPLNQIEDAKGVINETTEAMKKPRDPSAPRTRSMEEVYPGFSKATDLAYAAYFKITHGGIKLADMGHKLFLSILQTYTLPPALRKKVEIASRTYLKQTKPRLKEHGNARYLEMFAVYGKFMTTVRAHLEVAKLAVVQGKEHSGEGAGATKINVGDFTLINTGGFSEDVMTNVVDVVKKAQALLKSSGVGEVCYGDVQITGTISKSRTLAFYLLENDELFIRANVRPSIDSIQVVLHELGHRMEYKFLTSKKRQIESLYQKINWQERGRRFDDTTKARVPKPGEEVKSKGKTYKVVDALPERSGYKIHLERVDDPKVKAHVSLEGWLALKGESDRNFDEDPKFQGFVTDYAKRGGPSENFAEMFSYYCMGRLPVLQSVAFEELVFGTGKTAHQRSILRIASRWILEG